MDDLRELSESALINFENFEKACFNQSPLEHPIYKLAKKQLELLVKKLEVHVPHGTSVNDKESVNHPSHYNQGKIEVIDVIEAKAMEFHFGNAFKYVARAGKKDPKKYVEDLQKALWYIERFRENKTHKRITALDFVADQNCTGPIALAIKCIVDAHEESLHGGSHACLSAAICTLKDIIASEKAKKEV